MKTHHEKGKKWRTSVRVGLLVRTRAGKTAVKMVLLMVATMVDSTGMMRAAVMAV
jgi:hypothetical protein